MTKHDKDASRRRTLIIAGSLILSLFITLWASGPLRAGAS